MTQWATKKKNVIVKNDSYLLPFDFLLGFQNGTAGIIRTSPSTNIKTVNELPYSTELQRLPQKIKGQLDLINDKTLNTMKEIKNGTYIVPKHTDQQIEKVGKYI